MPQEKKQNRVTQAERATAGNIEPELLTEQEAAIFLGVSVKTLQDWRTRTPARWTPETLDMLRTEGKIIPPPFRTMGRNVKYERKALVWWITLLPSMGTFPEEVETA